MKKLSLHSAKDITVIATPEYYKPVDLYSPANNILTDFNTQLPLLIDGSSCATEVEYLMKKEHVRLKLVVDETGSFIGVITLKNLNAQEIIKKVASGFSRDEFLASDFMTPKSDVLVLDADDVKSSSIKDIIFTLSESQDQHALVMEHETKNIVGLISCSDTIKKLRLPMNINNNHTFHDLYILLEKGNKLH